MPAWFHADDGWIARLVIQRGIGVVYVLAYAVALLQFRPLLGERGLLPVPEYIAHVRFREAPSLFQLRYSDRLFTAVASVGLLLSVAIVLGLPDRWPVPLTVATWLVVWAIYLSIVNVGQQFYGFGWETLLLEAGFLAAFLGPSWAAVPAPVLWAFRWLLIRVELGAGLIKWRGDPGWRDLTCLDFHHETQPMPNPLSWWFHRLPKPLHRVEVLGSHLAQLVAPVLLLLPQPIAGCAALFMAITQSWLVLSGNFSWLNLITIVLTASLLDDRFFHLQHAALPSTVLDAAAVAMSLLVVALSYRPAKNLLSRRQLMNASFDPLHLVNTYGAFGTVERERLEVVVEGTAAEGAPWIEYEFRGKPTDPMRRPRQLAPYHLRLDWMMWFLALVPGRELAWFLPFLQKLLVNDAPTLRLLGKNPFPAAPPHAVRATVFLYRFTTWRERRETGAWWVRTRLHELVPPRRRPE